MSKYIPCPCSSKALYHKCCKRFHDGELPETALQLMRSRFSAYALNLSDYIVDTTHPENPNFSPDRNAWKIDIERFSHNTSFVFLEIREFIDGDKEAYVTFTANMRQGTEDASFTEKSVFEKCDGRWLYKSGEVT